MAHSELSPPSNKIRPITLVFWSKFGCYHRWADNSLHYHIDDLAGSRWVLDPYQSTPHETCPRTVFEIGRLPSCYIQINRHLLKDDSDPPADRFRGFSRKHVTFVWEDGENIRRLSKPQWMIFSGGVYAHGGTSEYSTVNPVVFLNGKLVEEGDPEILFPGQKNIAKLCLGKYGKILVVDGILSEHATGFPPEIWEGEGWPNTSKQEKEKKQLPPKLQQQVARQVAPAPASPWWRQDIRWLAQWLMTPTTTSGAVVRFAVFLSLLVAGTAIAILKGGG